MPSPDYSPTAWHYSFTTLPVLGGGGRNRTDLSKFDRFLEGIRATLLPIPPHRLQAETYTMTASNRTPMIGGANRGKSQHRPRNGICRGILVKLRPDSLATGVAVREFESYEPGAGGDLRSEFARRVRHGAIQICVGAGAFIRVAPRAGSRYRLRPAAMAEPPTFSGLKRGHKAVETVRGGFHRHGEGRGRGSFYFGPRAGQGWTGFKSHRAAQANKVSLIAAAPPWHDGHFVSEPPLFKKSWPNSNSDGALRSGIVLNRTTDAKCRQKILQALGAGPMSNTEYDNSLH